MRLFKTTLLVAIALFTLTGCCWTDHSETIRAVAEPMSKELEHFYTQEKRFPNTRERNEMLARGGCMVNGNTCLYHNNKIRLDEWHTKYDYKIRMTIKNTHGNFNLYKDSGKVSDIRFYQKPCIDLGQ